MSLTSEVPIPEGINAGVASAKQATMLSLLGSPRTRFDEYCRPVTHPKLASLTITADVGPFRTTGLKPAVDSLQAVFNDVKAADTTLYDAVGTAGMLCVILPSFDRHPAKRHV